MIELPITPLTDHQLFGSPEFPLRGSKLDHIIRCAGSVALTWVKEPTADTLGGAAAQTGNLVHKAVDGYHTNNNDKEAGDVALQQARAQFPGGDVKKAQKIFDAYAADQANQVTVPYLELKIEASFSPLPDDPLQLPIVIKGTCDQLRLVDGTLQVWDIKTGGRLTAKEYMDYHMYQVAGYAVAAAQTLQQPVEPGGLICTDGYATGQRVRTFAPWDYTVCLYLMRNLVRRVTDIRKGNIELSPSTVNCEYCPLKSISNCIPKYKELIRA